MSDEDFDTPDRTVVGPGESQGSVRGSPKTFIKEEEVYDEDWLQTIVGIHWSTAVEVKPGGRVFQTTGLADPFTVLIAAWVRISQASVDATIAKLTAKAKSSRIPILEFGDSTDSKPIFSWARASDTGDATVTFPSGLPPAPPADLCAITTAPGPGPPTSTPGAFYSNVILEEDNSGISFESAGGQVVVVNVFPDPPPPTDGHTIYVKYTDTEIWGPDHTIDPDTGDEACMNPGGGNAGGIWFGTGHEFYKSVESTQQATAPSVLWYNVSSKLVEFQSIGRQNADGNSNGNTLGNLFRSRPGAFLIGKWNMILFGLNLGVPSPFQWRMMINGKDVSNKAGFSDFFNNPAYRMALSGFEIGLPQTPKESTRFNITEKPQDLDYAAVQVWFGKGYVDPAKVIDLFLTSKKKIVKPDVAEKELGKADVWLDKGALRFVKNLGGAGAFDRVGLKLADDKSVLPSSLILDYSPYPTIAGKLRKKDP